MLAGARDTKGGVYGSTDEVSTLNNASREMGEHTVAFLDVNYTVTQGCRRNRLKTILNSVSGLMLPGLNAIMGPTGSGKTTLMDILADRKANKGLLGTVLINSRPRPQNFRFMVGYVVQDNVVMGTLSVRENLQFSAALRLPSHMSSSQRRERVERVIQELGLSKCADQLIGTEFFRGVSGGERKRTNIGMELIIEPEVLFLDEPTTGLDAHTAVSVVQLLKGLSTSGRRVVIMSIHQPRYAIFKLFDTLTLLSEGNLVYHGPPTQSIDHFGRLGFVCEEHDNPADFLLDVVTSCEADQQRPHHSVDRKDIGDGEADVPILQGDWIDLAEKYLQSDTCKTIMTRLRPIVNGQENVEAFNKSVFCSSNYATTFFWQMLILIHRSLLKMWRNPMAIVMQVIVMIIFALIVGGIYFQRDNSPLGLEDRVGAFFFIIMSQVFANLGAIELFIKERAAFIHENSSGYYRVSSFFLALVLTDIIPMRIIPLVVFSAITYFMVGFQADVSKYFIYVLTLALTSVAGATISFAFSAMVSVFAVANLLVSMVYIFQMLFGGFLVSLSSLPSWIRWMKYVSMFRYSIEALSVNELNGMLFNGTVAPNGTCPYEQIDNYCVVNGSEFLHYRGYEAGWLWYDQAALAATVLVWLALTYAILNLVTVYYRYYK